MAQAILTYTMSLFKNPIGLCKEIQAKEAKFRWSGSDEKGRYIGRVGNVFVQARGMKVWVLRISLCLIKLISQAGIVRYHLK